jgi:hypothetical protein
LATPTDGERWIHGAAGPTLAISAQGYFFLVLGRWLSADPAAVLLAWPVRPSLSTFDAAFAAAADVAFPLGISSHLLSRGSQFLTRTVYRGVRAHLRSDPLLLTNTPVPLCCNNSTLLDAPAMLQRPTVDSPK